MLEFGAEDAADVCQGMEGNQNCTVCEALLKSIGRSALFAAKLRSRRQPPNNQQEPVTQTSNLNDSTSTVGESSSDKLSRFKRRISSERHD